MQIEDKFAVALCDVNSSQVLRDPFLPDSNGVLELKATNFQNKKTKTKNSTNKITAQTKPQEILESIILGWLRHQVLFHLKKFHYGTRIETDVPLSQADGGVQPQKNTVLKGKQSQAPQGTGISGTQGWVPREGTQTPGLRGG